MRFDEFKTKVKDLPLLTIPSLRLLLGNGQAVKNQITRWQKSGKILRLRRGIYILNEADRKLNPSRAFIAGELYHPSYVSTEYALSFYGLIPERSADVTSVTSKKTAFFSNAYGKFVYQNIRNSCFAGFEEIKDEAGLTYFMALPEKALADFLYLNLNRFSGDSGPALTDSFRFQNTGILRKKILYRYGELFANNKLMALLKQAV